MNEIATMVLGAMMIIATIAAMLFATRRVIFGSVLALGITFFMLIAGALVLAAGYAEHHDATVPEVHNP